MAARAKGRLCSLFAELASVLGGVKAKPALRAGARFARSLDPACAR